MKSYTVLARSRFFEVLGPLHAECQSDHKITMISELDMSSACHLRSEFDILVGVRPSYTALVTKAVALALRQHSYANRLPVCLPFWKRIVQFHDTHVSVAVERDRPGAEILAYVVTLRHADERGLAELTRELQSVARKPEENCPRFRQFMWIIRNLPPLAARWVLSIPRWFPGLWVEHRGGAVLISSPAKYGVDALNGTWHWPLAFSFGFVKERPVVVAGQVVARPTMTLTMSFDRRVMAGAPAARFFKCVTDILENAQMKMEPNISEKQTADVF